MFQVPFSKSKGLVQCVLFHPIRPMLFVATQQNVRVYDLVKQDLVKKLITGAKWISSIAIHPGNQQQPSSIFDHFNSRKFYLHLRQYFSGFFSQKAWNCLTWSLITGGDNLLVGTYDKKVQWFDLDLSTMAYQVLRYHTNAVRDVQYHKRYPLFASCSDDNNITVSHGMVYNDLLQV